MGDGQLVLRKHTRQRRVGDVGLLAQEVVGHNAAAISSILGWQTDPVRYDKLLPVLTGCLKAQRSRIEYLEDTVKARLAHLTGPLIPH